MLSLCLKVLTCNENKQLFLLDLTGILLSKYVLHFDALDLLTKALTRFQFLCVHFIWFSFCCHNIKKQFQTSWSSSAGHISLGFVYINIDGHSLFMILLRTELPLLGLGRINSHYAFDHRKLTLFHCRKLLFIHTPLQKFAVSSELSLWPKRKGKNDNSALILPRHVQAEACWLSWRFFLPPSFTQWTCLNFLNNMSQGTTLCQIGGLVVLLHHIQHSFHVNHSSYEWKPPSTKKEELVAAPSSTGNISWMILKNMLLFCSFFKKKEIREWGTLFCRGFSWYFIHSIHPSKAALGYSRHNSIHLHLSHS